jgi:O-antigen biosynthesis protein
MTGLVSIIIPVWNQLEYTRYCLESIQAHTSLSHEIIVVDNNSTDDTPSYLNTFPGVRTIRNETNLGHAIATNRGIAVARGEILVLLNNDTVVTEGWLENLTACLLSAPDIGMVGPMTNYIGNTPQRIDGLSLLTLEEIQTYGSKFNRPDRSKWRENELFGFCFVLKQELVGKIGGLDERFELGLCDDIDFNRRVRQAGYRTLVAGDTFIFHFGSRSFKGLDMGGALQRSAQQLGDKWTGKQA